MPKLLNVVYYSYEKIQIDNISIKEYISVDNMLQNKKGVVEASSLPLNVNRVTRYNVNDILVGNIRPYLKKIWYATHDGGCSTDVLTFKVKDEYNAKFVYYSILCDAFFDHMMRGKKGTKMPRGNKQQVLDFKIPDYKFEYQKKIAETLTAIDKKIDINNQISTELENMAKTIYDYWFVQFNFPNVKGKPYKSSGGKMVWNEELKRKIPEGWGVGSLFEIAKFTNGLACQKYRPIDNQSLKVIKIREMHEGFTSETELVRPNIPQKVIIQNGDILFSWSASLEVQIWAKGTGALNQHIFKVTSDKYPKYFYYFQLLNYLEHFIMIAKSRKTTMGHITQDHLIQSRVVLPPKVLTEELNRTINCMLDKIVLINVENDELTSLRDWLLPMLMNGQVKVI